MTSLLWMFQLGQRRQAFALRLRVHAASYSLAITFGRLVDAALGDFLVVVPHLLVVQLGQVAIQIFLEQSWLLLTISGLSGPHRRPVFLPCFLRGRFLLIFSMRVSW